LPLAEKRPTEHGEIFRNLAQPTSLTPASLLQYALTNVLHAVDLVSAAHTVAEHGDPGPRMKGHLRSHTTSLSAVHALNMSSSAVHTEHAAHFAGAFIALGDHVRPGTQRSGFGLKRRQPGSALPAIEAQCTPICVLHAAELSTPRHFSCRHVWISFMNGHAGIGTTAARIGTCLREDMRRVRRGGTRGG
jgi:hypothetical protein